LLRKRIPNAVAPMISTFLLPIFAFFPVVIHSSIASFRWLVTALFLGGYSIGLLVFVAMVLQRVRKLAALPHPFVETNT
jgi:hypothetical protein